MDELDRMIKEIEERGSVGRPEETHSRFDELLVERLEQLGDKEFAEKAKFILECAGFWYS